VRPAVSFEGIALRTALILFPSPYSGVIKEWDHYIPLAKDFSNLDEVVRCLRDDRLVTEMTERAYADVILGRKYSYREFARGFDAAIEDRAHHRLRLQPTYNLVAMKRRVKEMRLPARLSSAIQPVTSRLRGPATVERLLRDPGGYSLKGYLALRAVARSPQRRATVLRHLGPGRRSGRTSLDIVFEDLLKLDILRQAHESRLTAGVVFKAWPHLDGDGVLEMRSLEVEQTDQNASTADEVFDALGNGQVTNLVWDHTALASAVWHALTRKRWVKLWVGNAGRHEFPLIRELLATDRELAIDLLRPLLDLPADALDDAVDRPPLDTSEALPVVVASATRRHRSRSVWRPSLPRTLRPAGRFLRHPIWYSTRSYVALRTIARHHPYRSLFLRYVVDRRMRRSAQVDVLLEDLLKMDLLKRACASPNGFHVNLQVSADSGQWSYVSTNGPRSGTLAGIQAQLPPQEVNRLSWDHSAIGNSVVIPTRFGKPVTVYLGEDGIYEFKALTGLHASSPEIVARILPIPD